MLRFFRLLGRKVQEDDLLFMAGAISFNLVAAAVPFLLLVVGLSGHVLAARVGDPGGAILALLLDRVPAVGGDIELESTIRQVAEGLVAERAGFSVVGALFLLWLSTRLVATLRVVLARVYRVPEKRGLVHGKAFDALLVVAGGALVLVNLGVTVAASAVFEEVAWLLPVPTWEEAGSRALGWTLAFLSIWVFFLLAYRYVPSRRTPWSTALLSATFTAVAFELMKAAFTWYATSVADYRSVYGNLATGAVLFFWVYYGSAVCILGAQAGHLIQELRDA